MKNKFISLRDVTIFALGILTAICLWLVLRTIRHIFCMLFGFWISVFILFVIVRVLKRTIKRKTTLKKFRRNCHERC